MTIKLGIAPPKGKAEYGSCGLMRGILTSQA